MPWSFLKKLWPNAKVGNYSQWLYHVRFTLFNDEIIAQEIHGHHCMSCAWVFLAQLAEMACLPPIMGWSENRIDMNLLRSAIVYHAFTCLLVDLTSSIRVSSTCTPVTFVGQLMLSKVATPTMNRYFNFL